MKLKIVKDCIQDKIVMKIDNEIEYQMVWYEVREQIWDEIRNKVWHMIWSRTAYIVLMAIFNKIQIDGNSRNYQEV